MCAHVLFECIVYEHACEYQFECYVFICFYIKTQRTPSRLVRLIKRMTNWNRFYSNGKSRTRSYSTGISYTWSYSNGISSTLTRPHSYDAVHLDLVLVTACRAPWPGPSYGISCNIDLVLVTAYRATLTWL